MTGKRCNPDAVVSVPLQMNGFTCLMVFDINIRVTDWNKYHYRVFKGQLRLYLFKNLFLNAIELFFEQLYLSIMGIQDPFLLRIETLDFPLKSRYPGFGPVDPALTGNDALCNHHNGFVPPFSSSFLTLKIRELLLESRQLSLRISHLIPNRLYFKI